MNMKKWKKISANWDVLLNHPDLVWVGKQEFTLTNPAFPGQQPDRLMWVYNPYKEEFVLSGRNFEFTGHGDFMQHYQKELGITYSEGYGDDYFWYTSMPRGEIRFDPDENLAIVGVYHDQHWDNIPDEIGQEAANKLARILQESGFVAEAKGDWGFPGYVWIKERWEKSDEDRGWTSKWKTAKWIRLGHWVDGYHAVVMGIEGEDKPITDAFINPNKDTGYHESTPIWTPDEDGNLIPRGDISNVYGYGKYLRGLYHPGTNDLLHMTDPFFYSESAESVTPRQYEERFGSIDNAVKFYEKIWLKSGVQFRGARDPERIYPTPKTFGVFSRDRYDSSLDWQYSLANSNNGLPAPGFSVYRRNAKEKQVAEKNRLKWVEDRDKNKVTPQKAYQIGQLIADPIYREVAERFKLDPDNSKYKELGGKVLDDTISSIFYPEMDIAEFEGPFGPRFKENLVRAIEQDWKELGATVPPASPEEIQKIIQSVTEYYWYDYKYRAPYDDLEFKDILYDFITDIVREDFAGEPKRGLRDKVMEAVLPRMKRELLGDGDIEQFRRLWIRYIKSIREDIIPKALSKFRARGGNLTKEIERKAWDTETFEEVALNAFRKIQGSLGHLYKDDLTDVIVHAYIDILNKLEWPGETEFYTGQERLGYATKIILDGMKAHIDFAYLSPSQLDLINDTINRLYKIDGKTYNAIYPKKLFQERTAQELNRLKKEIPKSSLPTYIDLAILVQTKYPEVIARVERQVGYKIPVDMSGKVFIFIKSAINQLRDNNLPLNMTNFWKAYHAILLSQARQYAPPPALRLFDPETNLPTSSSLFNYEEENNIKNFHIGVDQITKGQMNVLIANNITDFYENKYGDLSNDVRSIWDDSIRASNEHSFELVDPKDTHIRQEIYDQLIRAFEDILMKYKMRPFDKTGKWRKRSHWINGYHAALIDDEGQMHVAHTEYDIHNNLAKSRRVKYKVRGLYNPKTKHLIHLTSPDDEFENGKQIRSQKIEQMWRRAAERAFGGHIPIDEFNVLNITHKTPSWQQLTEGLEIDRDYTLAKWKRSDFELPDFTVNEALQHVRDERGRLKWGRIAFTETTIPLEKDTSRLIRDRLKDLIENQINNDEGEIAQVISELQDNLSDDAIKLTTQDQANMLQSLAEVTTEELEDNGVWEGATLFQNLVKSIMDINHPDKREITITV